MTGEITFTMIKPSAVAQGITGTIFSEIEQAGFRISALRMKKMTLEEAGKFYEIHRGRPFYPDLIEYMSSGPVVAAVLTKANAVDDFRKLIGETDPAKAAEGTIRKKYGENVRQNAIHGSDNDDHALEEAAFFFSKEERY